MMCGLLRRLSLEAILNLCLPLLACQQAASCRQDSSAADVFIMFPSDHVDKHTHACRGRGNSDTRLCHLKLNNAVPVPLLFLSLILVQQQLLPPLGKQHSQKSGNKQDSQKLFPTRGLFFSLIKVCAALFMTLSANDNVCLPTTFTIVLATERKFS